MKKMYIVFFLLFSLPVLAQDQSLLTVEKIMRDPKWIGSSPSGAFWGADGETLFFKWNPNNEPDDSLWYITRKNLQPVKATSVQKKDAVNAAGRQFNTKRTAATWSHDGDIYYEDLRTGEVQRLIESTAAEFNPVFSFDDKKIVYQSGQNLFARDITTGHISQLTNIQSGSKKKSDPTLSQQEDWLKNDQLQYLQVLKERKYKDSLAKAYRDNNNDDETKPVYIGEKRMQGLNISPDGRFITYRLYQAATGRKSTIIPDYVTESGFTTDIPGRTKVGEAQGRAEFYIIDRLRDTVLQVSTDSIEGIRDLPDYLEDYPLQKEKRIKQNLPRPVNFMTATWSPTGKHLVLDIRSQDNKDRWLMLWQPKDNSLKLLDRQRNEAWIGGPGMWNMGWIDDDHFWFQSEKTGYSHLYSVNVVNANTRPVTSGEYEVQDAQLSHDKKYFYVTTNEVHPGEKQFYRIRIADSKQERITSQTGANDVVLSPDEKTLAILYSYSNKPWELYLQPNKPGASMVQVTNKAQSAEFKAYNWRDPELVKFKARDGANVYGRLYKPANAEPGAPAVVFVHGAGYLQNAHKWWSSYFREYMFHNLLADRGYYVIDIDYRGSAGYGADWRTGIYRHMGGKDLTDNVDAAAYLVKNHGVDAKKIGIYGGSYGGFITLMALFTTPDVFAAGAGLRSVTDWANYNHGYTSNILNEPFNDSLAYRRSSPIYYAEGLKNHLLMCHGMVDVNVHFQDIVKLSQRLIELKKDNWELAVYPMEDHGFVEPSSWTDEYKRILKLFETVLKDK